MRSMDKNPPGERRERKDMRRNMERVLQAAHELFAERGPDVTMEEVARRAGVGVGTIYRRFANKDELFATVSNAVCADTQHCLHEAADDIHDPSSKLRAIIVTHYRRIAQQAALIDMRPALEAHGCGPSLEQQGLYATMHGLLQELIVEGQRTGCVRQGDPAVLAVLCLELLSPRTFANLRRVHAGDADALAGTVVHFVLAGLAPGGKGG